MYPRIDAVIEDAEVEHLYIIDAMVLFALLDLAARHGVRAPLPGKEVTVDLAESEAAKVLALAECEPEGCRFVIRRESTGEMTWRYAD